MQIKGYSFSFILLCLVGLATMFSVSLINPLLSIFAKEIGAVGLMIGYSVAGYWATRVMLEIPSGFISARFGYYLPMLCGLILTTVGTLWNAFVEDPIQLIMARAMQGLGAPLFFAVSMTFIVNMFSAERRGVAMGLFQGVEFGGSLLGSALSGYLITALGFRGGFILSTILCAFAALMLMFSDSVKKESRAMPALPSLKLSSLPAVFKNRVLIIVSFATLMEFILSSGILYTIYPLYARERLGMTLTEIGLLSGARTLGYASSMLVMGSIADRVGRKPVLLFGVASTAFMALALNYSSGIIFSAIILFLLGITTGAIWVVCPVMAAEAVSPENRGAAIGTYRTFFDIGSVLGPILMTYVNEAYGTSNCFFLSAFLLLVAFIPSITVAETRQSDNREMYKADLAIRKE